jgi:hypothetical protein
MNKFYKSFFGFIYLHLDFKLDRSVMANIFANISETV